MQACLFLRLSHSDDSDNSNIYVNYPLPSTEKSGTIATYERGQVVSEMHESNDNLQDCTVAEVLLNKPSLPQRTDGNQKQSCKTFQPGTRESVRPALKPPVSPKSAKNNSQKERPVKPASPSRLQREQINRPQFPQPFQLPHSPLLPSPLQPSPLQPSPIAGPPTASQTPKQNPVTPVNGSIPEKEIIYVPRLPAIKKRIQQKRLEDQQKMKEDPFIAKSPKIPGTSLSTDSFRPPSLPRVDPSLPPPPPKQMESIDQSLPNLTLSHEQTFHFPSSLSSGGDCQSPIKNEGRPCSTMTTTMFKPSDSMSAKERPLPAEPFTVDSEDSYSDHTYEHIDSGSLLVEDGNLSTFATDYRFAPLVPAKMPVGIQGDSASKEKPITTPISSDIRRRAEHLNKLLSREKEELDPSIAETSLSSPTATQYSQQKQTLKISHPGTRKPVKPATNPPVSQKSAKYDSLKRPVKLVSPSRLQGEKPNKAQQPQLSQRLPSSLHPSPITNPPPTYQVPKPSAMIYMVRPEQILEKSRRGSNDPAARHFKPGDPAIFQ